MKKTNIFEFFQRADRVPVDARLDHSETLRPLRATTEPPIRAADAEDDEGDVGDADDDDRRRGDDARLDVDASEADRDEGDSEGFDAKHRHDVDVDNVVVTPTRRHRRSETHSGTGQETGNGRNLSGRAARATFSGRKTELIRVFRLLRHRRGRLPQVDQRIGDSAATSSGFRREANGVGQQRLQPGRGRVSGHHPGRGDAVPATRLISGQRLRARKRYGKLFKIQLPWVRITAQTRFFSLLLRG